MGNTVLYLTDHWPYPPGESFVTNEIRDLAPHFDKVYVLPTAMTPLGEAVRPLPENCEVLTDVHDALLLKWNKMGFVRRMFSGLRQKGVLREIFASRPFAPREVIGEAAQIRTYCNVIADTLGPRYSELNAVVSFWLNRGASIAAELARRDSRLVAFSRGHGGDIYAHRRMRRHLPMQRFALRGLHGILPDSEAGVKHIQKKYPEVSTKVSVGRLGVDNHDAAAASNDDRLHIISVASLLPVKRIHLIAAALHHTSRSLKWTHIGGGETFDLVSSTLEGVGDNVEFDLMGQIDHDDVLDWFEENPADVFINVSSSEGLPVSIMEAFSYGIPVIATSVGGMPEIVSEDCGVLLDADFEPKELAALLEGWNIDNNGRREAALNKQRTEYSSSKNEEEFAESIGQAVAQILSSAVI